MVSDGVHGTTICSPVSVNITMNTAIGITRRQRKEKPKNHTGNVVFRYKLDMRTFWIDGRQQLRSSAQKNIFRTIHRQDRRLICQSRLTVMNQRCQLNGCSNRNAELTCSLVHVKIATFIFEFEVSIVQWEHVNLNAAYVLSRSYQ